MKPPGGKAGGGSDAEFGHGENSLGFGLWALGFRKTALGGVSVFDVETQRDPSDLVFTQRGAQTIARARDSAPLDEAGTLSGCELTAPADPGVRCATPGYFLPPPWG